MHSFAKYIYICTLAALCLVSLALGAKAQTQMGKTPWNFKDDVSRASIAALQMQHDALGAAGAGGSGAANVCGGGGGASSAMANYTCIIINNSDGAIVDADQISSGNQTSTSQTTTTTNGVTETSLSDILEGLQ